MKDLVTRAAEFAKEAHKDQKRKYSGLPYFVHLEEVANIVREVGGTDEMIAAGYLHDYIEDINPNNGLQIVNELFGPKVAELVENLTDVSKKTDGNRKVRKAIDLAHTAQACPEAKTIKLADLISNATDIVRNDPDFGRIYIQEKEALLKVLTEGDARLHARATKILIQAKKDLGL